MTAHLCPSRVRPFRRRALLAAMLAGLGNAAASADDAPPAAAPEGDGKEVQQLNRVVVTGSNIRRTDTETPSPVQVLTSEDIAKSGYSSVADVLHNVTANNMGSLGQATPGAFGAGGSGISLRGLTVGATLVLIDGHRMASYPLPDDGERDFVDISSIPIDAVERIEVLKDGASAVYGSDAIAGVVNVILKKSHEGGTLHAELGSSYQHDGTVAHLSGIAGTGKLDSDGYNAYMSVDYRHQNPVLLSDRPYLEPAALTAFGAQNLTPNPFNPYLQVSPRTENLSVLGKLSKSMADDWTLGLSGSILQSDATQVGLFNKVSPANGITNFIFGPNHPVPTPAAMTQVQVPGTTAAVSQTFPDLGPQTTKTHSTSYRLVSELNGSWGAWDVQAAAGLTRVETQLTLSNFISLPALQNALNNGSYAVGVNADGSTSTLGAAAGINGVIAPQAASTSHNDLHFISLRASRDVAKLDGGNLSVGGGVEYDHRSLYEAFPDSFSNGYQSSNIYAFGVGKQNVTAAYVELVAPVLRQLEIDAAARIDHYDTYGSSATPKLGIKYTPLRELTLRGTYAEGFRAPNPVEIGVSGSSAGFLPALADTQLCATQGVCQNIGGTELQLAGHQLQPEKSKSGTLGFILEPDRHVNVSVDYYDIRLSNQIVSVGLFGQDQIDNPAKYGTQLYRASGNGVANTAPTSPGDIILYGTYPFINVGETRTNGLDIDLRLRFQDQDYGRFTPSLQWSHMLHYTITRNGVSYELAGTHGPSFVSTNTGTPRDRAALGLTWEKGPFEITGTVNYTSSFTVIDPSYAVNSCDNAIGYLFTGGSAGNSSLCTVGSFTEFNLSGRYTLDRHWTFRGSVTNLFNRQAPVDAFASGSAGGGTGLGGAHYDPSLHQDGAVGRFLNVGMTYAF
ncbi:MAG: TonB-dependent receptor [Pseudomonadota bacterium]|nr:TonB-dependent receptor [Pseudomonadota bacterium]